MKKPFIFLISFVTAVSLLSAPPANPEIDAAIKPYIDSGKLPGAVAMIANRKGELLSVNCLGWQNIEAGRKVTPDSLCWIASQSKLICSTAMMMLVDEGAVDLDAPVTAYLPELKNLMVPQEQKAGWKIEKRTDRTITLRMLLSHTAGMRREDMIQQTLARDDIMPLWLTVIASANSPLMYEPGEGYRYSNQGIGLAAAVIEKVSGIPYEEFLQKRLFEPLGMSSATFWPAKEQLETLIIPYKAGEGGKLEPAKYYLLSYPLDDRQNRHPFPGGGLFCTPNDLFKFYRMLATGGEWNGKTYISEKALEEMNTRHPGTTNYGLGCVAQTAFFGHGGAMGTMSRIYRDSGCIVMFFMQQDRLPKYQECYDAFIAAADKVYDILGTGTANESTKREAGEFY